MLTDNDLLSSIETIIEQKILGLEQKISSDFEQRILGLEQKISSDFEQRILGLERKISEDMSRLERRVNAFESVPHAPIYRGRQFHGGVGVHSVSGATSGLKRYTR